MSKIAISLPTAVVSWIDQQAQARQLSRSAYILQLVEAQQAHEAFEELVAELKEIYEEVADDEIATSERWLANSAAHELDPYDWTPEEQNAYAATG